MIDEIASNDFQMIYIASCGEGINAFNLVESTLVQFPDSRISVVKVAHIRSESQVDELIDKVVPGSIRRDKPLAVKGSRSERQVLDQLYQISTRNQLYKSFIGMGYYNARTPTVIERNLLRNPAWYTSYTPYQAEISQGRLEALLNFQTMVSDLTGMEWMNLKASFGTFSPGATG